MHSFLAGLGLGLVSGGYLAYRYASYVAKKAASGLVAAADQLKKS